ncbi:TPR repeat-containing protein [Hyphomicrobium denitrificans ATCC 51888]|uniref:protein O-GlcNAc transferase n=1 Tax=Hyphomicrobium denitrificans (strain ATCC 51888 / DSM 1869 / NCIMB 11706 / TK 0415) TaxID=582899 RepID=D8JVS6_HYPDA|nr:tetratricopeptide repeat protein [Hyphomicrobium denitrificans]ADJ22965.1 TPR repeat-containing protein [Hyphomicrobium denitrificans ATCC 51888]
MNRKERRRAQATASVAPHQIDPAIAADYREAVNYLQAGEWLKSETAHRRVLAKAPGHPPTLHHLGLIAFKCNDGARAVDYIRQSLASDPKYHQAWLNLAIILADLKRSQEAIEACKQCVGLQPENSAAFEVLGNLLRVAESNAEAIDAYLTSLRLKPEQPRVLARLAEMMLQSGKCSEALTYCRRALVIDPSLDELRRLEQRILAASGSINEIEATLSEQTKSPEEIAQNLNELGDYLRTQWRYEEAIDVYSRAALTDPSSADALLNMALAFTSLGRKEEALASYQAGLAIDPDRAEAYASVGNLLRGMGMADGAIQAYEKAIDLNSTLALAHYNLAVTLKERERYDEALAAFSRSVEHAPDSVANRFERMNLRRVLCDWEGLDREEADCLDQFRQRKELVAPFQLISIPSTRADQLQAGRKNAATLSAPVALRFTQHRNGLGVGQRIRVGFLSADFFNHATAMLLVEVLENIDRSRFELFGYCFSPDDGSDLRRRVVAAFDHYVPIGNMTDRNAARAIHDDGIDILVDLKGYTRDGRPEILSYRPAPIQVNYLGYPGSMGMDGIDYIVADPIVAPMAHQGDYSERIVHLPDCYQPNDRKRTISELPVTRADAGLPEDAFVFCSFNNSYKLNATMFDVWMSLLRNVDGSVLWLLVPTATCRENLRREAAQRGVDPDRLVFASRKPIAEHLARHRLADLFLDALPCNAHTTASDALWAGLPVITATGETFSGRVAASLLTAVGLPELVTKNLDDYAELALALARDKSKLADLNAKLSRQRETAPLFDSMRYTKNFERALSMMCDIARAGEPPRAFAVVD